MENESLLAKDLACPASGPNCGACLAIAEHTMGAKLATAGVPDDSARVITENAYLPLFVQEENGVTALPCEERRARAARIGADAASRFMALSQRGSDA